MKPFSVLRKQMEARRRAEGKTVEMFLDLPYRIKSGEEVNLLEPFEAEEINEKINGVRALLGPDQLDELRSRVKTIKVDYIAGVGSFSPRITARLLYAAVELRYRKDTQQGPRIEVPRKGPDKTKPGVWWGDLQVQLEDYPKTIDLPVNVAQWLVATWQDDKVQNGLDAKVQAWANVFDQEIERLSSALNAKPVPGPAGLGE